MRLSEIELSTQQQDIVFNTDGNIVVSASAGTGKTRTMIAKIIHDLEKNKTHKTVAAITFTIRAAQEIRERLPSDVSQCFIGTNNSFAIEEIIKPFMKDVYGEEFNFEMDTDYADKENKFETLTDGIEKLRSTKTIYKYKNDKKNFVFDLALDILKKSSACRLYLQAKYFGIFIDEYQDCDVDMHKFFMYICDTLGITTFIVGDDKQSIYRWRGANPESFKAIFKKANFNHKELTENHRSDKQIQDYSNLLFVETKALVTQPQNQGNIIWVMATNDNWASKVIPLLDSSRTSALLRYANNNTRNGKQGASEGADLLTANGIQHIFIPPTPIDDITTSTAWLYTAVASYILLPVYYSAYDFIYDIPAGIENSKITVGRIKQMLIKIQQSLTADGTTEFSRNVIALTDYLGYASTPQHIEKLYQTVTDTKYAVSLNPEKPRHCTLTLHSSKGLEFDQVILFIEDYATRGEIRDEHVNNHYVACTRAKSKLIIVDTNSQDAQAARRKVLEKIRSAGIEPKTLLSLMK